jgi:glycosyltransferase involved in cell wall biosynthesis
MKILVLIHEFPPIGGGGGRVAQDICQVLARQGHEITVLTAHLAGLPKEETVDGIRVLRLSSFRREAFRADLKAMAGYVLSGLWAGYQLIKRWQPELIHVHFAVPAGALAWALSKLTGVPYLMTIHLGDVPGGVPEKTGRWFRWVMPFTHPIWRDAKRVVAVSAFTRQLALEHYRREIEVIPNGVDLTLLRPAGIRVQKVPRIVFAGRLIQQKNPLQIVRTLAALKDLPWDCVIIGDGLLMSDVQHAIVEYGLGERFTLTGWIAPENVLEWFDRSDILFMPSLSEGMSVVGVQALAKGLAMVVSKIGGFVDIVDDGENGYLVELSDPSRFPAVLRELLSDEARLDRFRRASLKKALRFDRVPIAKRYEQILLEVCSANQAGG